MKPKLKGKATLYATERTEQFLAELGALLKKYDSRLYVDDSYGDCERYLGRECYVSGGGFRDGMMGVYIDLAEVDWEEEE